MGELVLPLLVVGALLALGVLLVAIFVVRRYLLTRPVGTFDCSLNKDPGSATASWMLGVARYEADRLDWFRVFAVSPRPGRSLARSRLVILDRREPEGSEAYAVMPDSVVVRCAYGQSVLELAMSDDAYNGFAAWIESAPPGQPLFTT